jgi:hypothetical protein
MLGWRDGRRMKNELMSRAGIEIIAWRINVQVLAEEIIIF